MNFLDRKCFSPIGHVNFKDSVKTTTGYRAAYPVVAICRAFTVVILAMICWLGLQSRSHAQLTATWNGTTGMWSDPSRWSTAEFPDNGNGGFNYNAVVGAGTVTLDQNITIEELTLSGGVLSGSSPLALTLNSGFLWTGGSLSGSFTIQANGGMSLDGGTKTFNAGHTLNNGGVANWTSGNINSGGGAAFNNQVGASFNTDFDGSFNFNQGGALPQFHNAGTFTKSGGAGSTVIGAAFHNSGLVGINSGTVTFNSSYLQTAGALVLNGGNANSNSTLVIDGGEIQGDGILIANVNNTGGTMSPGFSAGQITVDGNLFSGANSSWLMQIGGLTPASEYDFLQVTGNLSLNGVLNLELINGFEANIQPGDLFTLATSANLSGAFSNIASGSSMTVGSTTFDIFYGSGSPYGSHSVVAFVSVPEPGSGGLVLLAIVLGMAGRRLRNDEGSK